MNNDKIINTRNILIIVSYILLVTLFFVSGYAIGGISNNDIATISTPTPKVNEAFNGVKNIEETKLSASSNEFNYKIILVNSELFLYKNNGYSKELIYSHPIQENIYPEDDINELKKGVYFSNLSDAQKLLENFVS